MEQWAKRLQELMNAKGLKMPGLVKAVRAAQPTVRQWFIAPDGKSCTKMIDAIYAVRAAAYVGTTAEYLMTGKGDGASSQPARLDPAKLARIIDEVGRAVAASKKVPVSKRPAITARWAASLYEQGIAESAVQSILTSLLSSLEEV